MTLHEEHEGRNLLSEAWLEEVAASFDYPPTPDVSRRVRQRLSRPQPVMTRRRRLAWAVTVVLLLLASLLAVPQVRAALGEILRIGAMTIFVGEPAEGPPAAPAVTATRAASSPTPTATSAPVQAGSPTATPALSPTARSLVVPATPVPLAAAREMVGGPLPLPAYPEDLGEPDGVYVDRRERPGVVVLVWDVPGRPGEVRMSLYQIHQEPFASKFTEQVAETTVNGRRALWIEGPHLFQLADGSFRSWQFVSGPVLIWTEDTVTYRLEGAPSLEEAVRIAESLEERNE